MVLIAALTLFCANTATWAKSAGTTVVTEGGASEKSAKTEKPKQTKASDDCKGLKNANKDLAADTAMLSKEIRKIAADTVKLNKEIKRLAADAETLNKKVVTLRTQKDSIAKKNTELTGTINKNNNNINSLRAELQQQISLNEANKQKIEIITNSYNLKVKTFDELIRNTTIQTVHRDMTTFFEGNPNKKVLEELLDYFRVKEILNKPYKDAVGRIADAQNKLNGITAPSDSVKTLREDIDKYKECGEALRTAITAIIKLEVNKVPSGPGFDDMRKDRRKDIALIMFRYISDNPEYVKFNDLSNIVSQIIIKKDFNHEADINEFLKRLQPQ